MSIAVRPRGPGEAELRGQTLRGGWRPCLPGLARSAVPRALHYLVSWLESCASLTRLCTSMSVLSLVPERSFSAPICSRTTDRCSAVHFRTNGFRWLKGNSHGQGLSQGMGFGWGWGGIPRLAHWDLQLCLHVSCHSGLPILSLQGSGESSRKTSPFLTMELKARDVPRPTACPPSLCLPELMCCLCLSSRLTFSLPRIPYLCLLSPQTKLVLSGEGERHCPLSPGKYRGTPWFPGGRQQVSLSVEPPVPLWHGDPSAPRGHLLCVH